MPLDRNHMTLASTIMTKAYIVFFCVIGANFAFSHTRIFDSPMLRYADRLMPIQLWGTLFFTCGLLMLTALLLKHRMLYRYGLLVCGISMGIWTLVAIVGLFFEPISFSAWAWPALVAAACAASDKSLSRNEQDQRTGH